MDPTHGVHQTSASISQEKPQAGQHHDRDYQTNCKGFLHVDDFVRVQVAMRSARGSRVEARQAGIPLAMMAIVPATTASQGIAVTLT